MRVETKRAAFWALPVMAALLVLAWQWATVSANYAGNWTALFCTGSLQRHPPLVASEHIYLFANSTGYDGQMYHYIAHDPLMRSDLKSYIDDSRLRYRRILIPLLAYGVAMGRSNWIDPAFELVFLISIGLGVYWSSRFAQQLGLPASWGLLFLLMPAVPIAADRLVVDAGLGAHGCVPLLQPGALLEALPGSGLRGAHAGDRTHPDIGVLRIPALAACFSKGRYFPAKRVTRAFLV